MKINQIPKQLANYNKQNTQSAFRGHIGRNMQEISHLGKIQIEGSRNSYVTELDKAKEAPKFIFSLRKAIRRGQLVDSGTHQQSLQAIVTSPATINVPHCRIKYYIQYARTVLFAGKNAMFS